MTFEKIGTGEWLSSCGNYRVSELCEPTEDGRYMAAREDWNHYLGTGTKKEMVELCEQHNMFN